MLCGVSLLEDQRHALAQMAGVIEDENPDAVVVAGDVYDRSIPPADAVTLLDNVVTDVVDRLRTPMVFIAGNHDGANRLEFGANLLSTRGLHIIGTPSGALKPVRIKNCAGALDICAVPFTDPAQAREFLDDETISTHDAAMRAFAARLRAELTPGVPSVLVAHAFVSGGSTSESERSLSVGGADQVGADCFAGFTYVALGHLHRPQVFDGGRVRYSGSLLKYSKSEAGHAKSFSIAEFGHDGECSVREIPVTPRHDLRVVRGKLADLEAGIGANFPADDYLYVSLDDDAMPVNAMNRLRARFPNTLDLDLSRAMQQMEGIRADTDYGRMSNLELFTRFFKEATDAELDAVQRALVMEVLEEMARDEREAMA
jgi:exonuclease SbcD